MYRRLVAYKKEHNDTKVPQHYKEDQRLGNWVNNQRNAYQKKKMTVERKRVLDSIGFKWTTAATWEEMYQRLVAYRKEHNDTKVQSKYKEDPQLGYWVNTQCIAYKKEKMTGERKRLLNSIGFVWDANAQVNNAR